MAIKSTFLPLFLILTQLFFCYLFKTYIHSLIHVQRNMRTHTCTNNVKCNQMMSLKRFALTGKWEKKVEQRKHKFRRWIIFQIHQNCYTTAYTFLHSSVFLFLFSLLLLLYLMLLAFSHFMTRSGRWKLMFLIKSMPLRHFSPILSSCFKNFVLHTHTCWLYGKRKCEKGAPELGAWGKGEEWHCSI